MQLIASLDAQVPCGWLLFQGEAFVGKLQSSLHLDAAAAPAEGIWALPDSLLIRAVKEGGAVWDTRKATV